MLHQVHTLQSSLTADVLYDLAETTVTQEMLVISIGVLYWVVSQFQSCPLRLYHHQSKVQSLLSAIVW